MKNVMRIIVLTLMFITIYSKSSAQKLYVKGGLNFSKVLYIVDDETVSDDFDTKTAYHVGLVAEFPISDIYSFETGLLLSAKGFKMGNDDFETKMNLTYLDIPLTAKATFDVGSVKLFGLFGPYVGVGLSGKFKRTYEGETETEDVRWGSDEDADVNRLDFGLTAGAGIELKAFQIGLNYSFGLANMSPDSYDISAKNRVLGISVAYRFFEK